MLWYLDAVYLSVPCDADESHEAKELLEPYLKAFLQLTGKPEQEPLLTFYYKFSGDGLSSHDTGGLEQREGVYVLRDLGKGLVAGTDRAAQGATAKAR